MKIWLAPMHGITNYNFRNCFTTYFSGIDGVIAPFIAAHTKDQCNLKKMPDLLPENNTILPIIPQLMGNKSNEIIDTILLLNETFGYTQFNWNIGCPVRQIVSKKRGCGIMPYPDLVEKIVNDVCEKTSMRLSIKMRMGLQSHTEGLEILQRLSHYPIDFLCIHPRLGIQQYKGKVNLDIFEILYKTTNHKIIYSGDICNLDFFAYLQKRFPEIDNWMLGRGLLQNPFLAEIFSKYPVDMQNTETNFRFISFYNEYSKLLLSLIGEKKSLGVLKELWHYFSVFWELNPYDLRKLLQINDYQLFFETTRKVMREKSG